MVTQSYEVTINYDCTKQQQTLAKCIIFFRGSAAEIKIIHHTKALWTKQYQKVLLVFPFTARFRHSKNGSVPL